MSDVLDMGNSPEAWCAGVGDVLVKDGVVYVSFFSWSKIGDKPAKVVTMKIVLPANACPAEWLRWTPPLLDEQRHEEGDLPLH